ncbi:argininosuccinate lyase [Patescibacteria group bacterium]|nr:argininosuccinate lyase [Patescibacteria group bacterium]
MKTQQTTKLWGTAFHEAPSAETLAFTAGRDAVGIPAADMALLPYDLWVNQAHTVMLAKTGIIPVSDAAKILSALSLLEEKVQQNAFELDPSKEDVHTNIESWLTKKIGFAAAGKLHTARSRNDQIVTDMRLLLRDLVLTHIEHCIALSEVLLVLADNTRGVLMPGFTHHQHAMMTTLGHTFAGFASMVIRDTNRLQDWYGLHNSNPLGGAASYGTSYPIDTKMTAHLLGFDGAVHNSLDAIMNRWEPEADFAYAVTILMNHLSSIAETCIVLSMPEFGMVTFADAYSSGSSIMPQKKNPAVLEVIKGKAGYVIGQLVGLLALGKANFIGYNNDSQWTKYMVLDIARESASVPTVLAGALETMTIHEKVMASWCLKSCIGATTLMEQLSAQFAIPMRQAKIIVEMAVKSNASGDVIPAENLIAALNAAGVTVAVTPQQVAAWQEPATAVSLIKSSGGPGKNSMKTSLKKLHKKLTAQKVWLVEKQKVQQSAKKLLVQMATSLMKGGEKQ